jgi:hypothetical protein
MVIRESAIMPYSDLFDHVYEEPNVGLSCHPTALSPAPNALWAGRPQAAVEQPLFSSFHNQRGATIFQADHFVRPFARSAHTAA